MSTNTSGSSSSAASTSEFASNKTLKPIHLIVLCHGLWGEPKHLRTLETLLANSFGEQTEIVNATGKREKGKETAAATTRSTSTKTTKKSKEEIKREKVQKEEEELDILHEKLLSKYATIVRDKNAEDHMDVVILNTSSNQGGKTYDGIDWLGERVVREIKIEQRKLVKEGKQIQRFSMIGYSLGGLVVRFAAGLLESQSFFTPTGRPPIQARQVITIATPHIGSPPGSGTFGRLVGFFGSRLLSRTGEQIYGADQGWQAKGEKEKVGLLEYMSKPNTYFIRALNRFEKVHFYANAVNDITVPFRTGCIELWDPFVEQEDGVDVKVLSDASILTDVQLHEPEKQTFLQTVRTKISKTPGFLNPNRIPMNFPYNYIIFFGLPVLLPFFTIRVVYKLSKDSQRSRIRIEELERKWNEMEYDVEEEDGEEQKERNIDSIEDKTQTRNATEERTSKLMKNMVMAITEDNVESERDLIPNLVTPHKNLTTESSDTILPPWHSPWKHGSLPNSKKQAPLSQAQRTMVENLNNPDILPKLTKVWTYYPDMNNSHAIIIARSLSIEPHRKGLPIVKHIVDDFLS